MLRSAGNEPESSANTSGSMMVDIDPSGGPSLPEGGQQKVLFAINQPAARVELRLNKRAEVQADLQ